VYLDPSAVIASPATGILYPLVERDQVVAKGTVVARITDYFGVDISLVESPLAGKVLYVVATPPIVKGQPVACVAGIA
jgi:predicted deacylase